MPYAPGTEYHGDAYIANGQNNAWQTFGGILQQQLAAQKQRADQATALRKAIDVYAPEGDAGDAVRNWSKGAGLPDLEGFLQGSSMVAARNAAMAKAQSLNVKTGLNAAMLNDKVAGQTQLGPFLQAWQQGQNTPTMTPGDAIAPVVNPMNLTPQQPTPTGAPDVLGALLRAGQQYPAGLKASGAMVPLLRRMALFGPGGQGGPDFQPGGGTVQIPMGDGSSLTVPYLKTSKGSVKSLEEFTPGNPKYSPRGPLASGGGDAIPLHDENGNVMGYGVPNARGGITQLKTAGKSEDTGPSGEPVYSKDKKMYWDSHYKAWKPVPNGKTSLFDGGGSAAAPAAAADPSDPLGLGLGLGSKK